MRTQADWFTQEAEVAQADPADPFGMPVEEVGERIDLRDPKATLELRLRELMTRESNLYNAGLTCPIKDRPDSTCHACPVSQAHEDVPLATLCRIGRDQEVVLTELAVLACPDR
jgi:hypothetical protein